MRFKPKKKKNPYPELQSQNCSLKQMQEFSQRIKIHCAFRRLKHTKINKMCSKDRESEGPFSLPSYKSFRQTNKLYSKITRRRTDNTNEGEKEEKGTKKTVTGLTTLPEASSLRAAPPLDWVLIKTYSQALLSKKGKEKEQRILTRAFQLFKEASSLGALFSSYD